MKGPAQESRISPTNNKLLHMHKPGLEEMQAHYNRHTPNYTALDAKRRDPVTDLRVIDVGGARATNKIQNKGSILLA